MANSEIVRAVEDLWDATGLNVLDTDAIEAEANRISDRIHELHDDLVRQERKKLTSDSVEEHIQMRLRTLRTAQEVVMDDEIWSKYPVEEEDDEDDIIPLPELTPDLWKDIDELKKVVRINCNSTSLVHDYFPGETPGVVLYIKAYLTCKEALEEYPIEELTEEEVQEILREVTEWVHEKNVEYSLTGRDQIPI